MRQICEKLVLLFACVLLIELFVCNYRHWESLGNRGETQRLSAADLEMESGYFHVGENIFAVTGDETGIEIKGIDKMLYTARIDIQVMDGPEEERKPVTLWQWVKDESHRLYYGLPAREIWKEEARSSYITYHLYGKCSDLRIVPDVSAGQTIYIEITLNPVIPLFFSWERVLVLFALAGLVWALKPSSFLHQAVYLSISARHRKTLLVLFFGAHMFLFWRLTGLNPYFQVEEYDNQKQYQELAESLRAGSFAVLEEPPLALTEMENPYDMDYRNEVMSRAGVWYKWDHAYYEGKYYVYFGVVPAILFYLPYYVITGTHLPNHTVIFLLALLFMAGCLGTVHEMIRKWFSGLSLGVWFLLNELLLLGSGIIYMTKRPDLYTVPILAGLSFGMLGLWCFLQAGRDGRFSVKYVWLGSLFLALIAGCRPQLFLFAVPAVILLWESIRDAVMKRETERTTRATVFSVFIAVAVPMIIIASGLMYYNYSRFGSIFDFGANYNLTMNDMRKRGFHIDRIPLGIFAYLFQPVKLIQRFPFMEAVYFDSQYMGVTIQEATYGGILAANLFAWIGIASVFWYKHLKKQAKLPWLFSVSCLAMAGIIMMADTSMSGILQRYFGDFSVLLMLSSVTVSLLIVERLSAGGNGGEFLKRVFVWGLFICLLWQIGYQGMAFFLDTGESLKELRPDLYSHMKYLVWFWG